MSVIVRLCSYNALVLIMRVLRYFVKGGFAMLDDAVGRLGGLEAVMGRWPTEPFVTNVAAVEAVALALCLAEATAPEAGGLLHLWWLWRTGQSHSHAFFYSCDITPVSMYTEWHHSSRAIRSEGLIVWGLVCGCGVSNWHCFVSCLTNAHCWTSYLLCSGNV